MIIRVRDLLAFQVLLGALLGVLLIAALAMKRWDSAAGDALMLMLWTVLLYATMRVETLLVMYREKLQFELSVAKEMASQIVKFHEAETEEDPSGTKH